jgi:hypothetical protein
MAFSVTDFRSKLVGDGARPNLFEVNLTFPQIISNSVGFSAAGRNGLFLIKSSQLPGSTVGQAPLYYFGREMKFAGNRTFSDWTVTIINDEDFSIRNTLENWMNAINSHAGNTRASTAVNPSSYTTNATVSQYVKSGTIAPNGIYNFVGIFPIDISPIDLDWGSNDVIEEYQVTFAYQYWTNATSTDS